MATFLIFCVLITGFCSTVIWVEADEGEQRTLRRQKREWIIPPRRLYENVDYTRDEFIAKEDGFNVSMTADDPKGKAALLEDYGGFRIRSDEETRTDIEYSLIGAAVDEGLFNVGRKNGFVKINGILDREKASSYELKGRATLTNGSLAERDLDLKIIVLDQNDCPPVFNVQVVGSVNELSEEGTHIIVITAIDADEPDTPHSQIAYKVIQQQPPGMMMFQIERSTGEIRVRINTLDRETQDTYRLIVIGTDMNGQTSDAKNKPLTGTGTVTISILDVNDNVPVLEKSYYEGSVEENTINVEAVRIKAIDMDLIHTENWEAVYTIVSGNEAGYFNITTDSKTNEGILLVTKELDYEQLKEVNLAVVVNNKAGYHKSVVIDKPKTYPIKINVVNIPEAPHFHPAVKVVSISEDRTTIELRKVITTYTATDSDTLSTATNVRYIKGEDVDNWVNINEHTAEIRLNKYPDHESKFLVNGTYYTKILCITNDFSPKTATGTLAIQVQDFNDHCPVLTSSVEMLCYGNSVVYVTATDGDKYPNAEPFEFKVVSQSTKENWSVERLNETTVILRSQEILWPGYYTVGLDVQDQQGKSCEVQNLQVAVCTCTEAQVCQAARQTSNSSVLGAGGVLALLLGILLLLLIPLILLLCECGGAAGFGHFQAFPFEQKQQLITYHTEGQGEDKELVLLSKPHVDVDGGGGGGQLTSGWGAHEDWRKYGWESYEEYMNSQWCSKYDEYMKKQKNGFGGHAGFFTASSFEGMALSETYLGNYYGRKAQEMVMQEASQDLLLMSSYETCNSITGSLEDLSICMQEENNLDFLNDLGPQFRRLAEISCGSAIELDFSSTSTPSKIISSSSQVGIKMEGAASGIHSDATSVSASSSSSTTQITTSSCGEKISSGSATSAATAGQTLLIQQPTVYLSSAPVYLVENRQQPTLFLASGPVLGVQESNMVFVEKGHTNMSIAAQNTLPRLGLQQSNTRVLVDQGFGGRVVCGISGHPEPQGAVSSTVQYVESRQVESTEPVHVMQSSPISVISKSQSMQAQGEMNGVMAPGKTSSALLLSQQNVPRFAKSNSGTQVLEERVSVVKKSFQSSSAS